VGLIPSGLLSDTVTLQSFTLVSNGAGGFTKTWTDVANVQAKLVMLTSQSVQEALAGEQPSDAELVECWLNAQNVNVTGGMRFRDSAGSEYEIVGMRKQGPLVRAIGRKV
jgi:head-tail adaptor